MQRGSACVHTRLSLPKQKETVEDIDSNLIQFLSLGCVIEDGNASHGLSRRQSERLLLRRWSFGRLSRTLE